MCFRHSLISHKNFLVEKRRSDDVASGYSLPSGHVEANEELCGALRREIMEELELDVHDAVHFWTGLHRASDGEIQRIHYYIVKDWTGQPPAQEAEAMSWNDDPNILSYEVDKKAIQKVIGKIKDWKVRE